MIRPYTFVHKCKCGAEWTINRHNCRCPICSNESTSTGEPVIAPELAAELVMPVVGAYIIMAGRVAGVEAHPSSKANTEENARRIGCTVPQLLAAASVQDAMSLKRALELNDDVERKKKEADREGQ